MSARVPLRVSLAALIEAEEARSWELVRRGLSERVDEHSRLINALIRLLEDD